MRATTGAAAAVAAAASLLTVGLAGGPLYVSSAASEAVQVGLAQTCATDAGLALSLPFFLDPAIPRALDERAARVSDVEPPIHTVFGRYSYHVKGGDDDLTDNLVLLARDGQLDELGRDGLTVESGEVLAPESTEAHAGVTTGRVLLVDVPGPSEREPLSLVVAGRYPDVPYRPEPSYWCGLRDLFRPNNFGDLPPPVMIVVPETFEAFPDDEFARGWELRPQREGMTRHSAKDLLADYAEIVAWYDPQAQDAFRERRERGDVPFARLPAPADPALVRIVAQAETVADVVGRTMAPIRLAGSSAAAILLTGAGVLVARERRRELRLRVLRGDGPWRLALRAGAGQLAPILAGTGVGATLAFGAVRLLGPTPELEPGPVRSAIAASCIGALAATALVGAVIAVVATRAVDAPVRRRHRPIPWEVAIVVLAVLSYLRLDKVGGVRLVGAEAKGGDLLAQAFPLLALAAPLALCVRPLHWAVRQSRRRGAGLPTPLLVGIRRIAADAATGVAITLATALAIGVFVVATSMTDSARQLLQDKAHTYLGGDEVVTVAEIGELPRGLTGTVVGRLAARSDGLAVDVIGVDPATFADTVRYRADGADAPLDQLLGAIADPASDATLPAIIIGGELGSTTLVTYDREELLVHPVASARWFPGQHAGATYVVVDRDAFVATGLALAEEVWLRDPPPDADARLTAAGFTPRGSLRSSDVFDVISFLAVQWSYSALRAFGVVVGAVIVLAQLLVLDARRRSRQAAFVLTRPMGATAVGEGLAVLTELAVPFLAGLLLATPLSVAVLRIAVPRFDTLRQLPPPARTVLDPRLVVGALGIGALALVALAVIGAVAVRRARPMEVLRGG